MNCLVDLGRGGRHRPLRDHFPPHRSSDVTIPFMIEAKPMMALFLGRAREIELRWLQKRAWLEKECACVKPGRKVRGL